MNQTELVNRLISLEVQRQMIVKEQSEIHSALLRMGVSLTELDRYRETVEERLQIGLPGEA